MPAWTVCAQSKRQWARPKRVAGCINNKERQSTDALPFLIIVLSVKTRRA